MQLVKDVVNAQVCFYWLVDGRCVSPVLSSFELAQQFRKRVLFKAFDKACRRKTTRERRKNWVQRAQTAVERSDREYQAASGRRESDTVVEVSLDLSVKKLAELEQMRSQLRDA